MFLDVKFIKAALSLRSHLTPFHLLLMSCHLLLTDYGQWWLLRCPSLLQLQSTSLRWELKERAKVFYEEISGLYIPLHVSYLWVLKVPKDLQDVMDELFKLKTARDAVQFGLIGSAIGAVSAAIVSWKYSRSLHGLTHPETCC